jgi:hypothetical protein
MPIHRPAKRSRRVRTAADFAAFKAAAGSWNDVDIDELVEGIDKSRRSSPTIGRTVKYLVDSDWVADYLKGRAAAVSLLREVAPESLATSILTYGEIGAGVIARGRVAHAADLGR